MNPLPGVRLTVINPKPTAPYTGMLPGYVAGHYAKDEVEIDLIRLARLAGARIILDMATGLDRASKECLTGSGRRIRYDFASIDVGITAQASDIEGFDAHAIAVKPMDRFASAWDQFLQEADAGRTAPNVAILGGGIGGAEIALAIAHRLGKKQHPNVTIVEAQDLLGTQRPGLARKMRSAIEQAGITISQGMAIRCVKEDRVILSDGTEIPSNLTIGATGARAQVWLADTGLDLQDGYVCVGPTLQSTNDPDILAVGDCAHLTFAPRPKAGVFAVRAASVLYSNLVALLSGKQMHSFRPQRDFLKIVSLGRKTAIAEKWGLGISGDHIWQWKDRIDHKFMTQFLDLQPMPAPALPNRRANGMEEALGEKPLCGGCGAKVSSQSLTDTLQALKPVQRPDVLNTAGDDAAILAGPDGQMQVLSTDHLRSFTNDPALMGRLATIHALGDIWAMGARPQAATVSLTIPPMSLALQNNVLNEIMNAVSACLSEVGTALVGGHTSKGAELSIGLTVTGLTDRPITNAGAQAGDVLILTKPVGTGTILAAEMQGMARGAVVAEAYQQMSVGSDAASVILSGVANSMTDVTGFGLAGHINNISKASNKHTLIDISSIPFMTGAVELAACGIRSSLFSDNVQTAPHLLSLNDARTALLFDPQTCGGLLAAVPEASADEALARLVAAGSSPAIIGRVSSGPARLSYA